MGKRPKRKVILFLVEGDSERDALRDRIAELYDSIDESIEVFFPEIVDDDETDPDTRIETGGDITQKYEVYPGNYDDQVYEYFLRDFFDVESLLPKDITEVIQIIDTDGAYISDDCRKLGMNPDGVNKTYYGEKEILSNRPQTIISRHKRKRLNVDYLVKKDSIHIRQKTVPFSVYYFSCNLDHFLHNTQNMRKADKTIAANAFSDGYIGDPDGFVHVFLDDDDAAKNMTYEESWGFITQTDSFASLERHTNFDLLIRKILSQST